MACFSSWNLRFGFARWSNWSSEANADGPDVDCVPVDLSVAGAGLSAIAAAQTMFAVTAQAAAPVAASGDGATGVEITVLRMALDNERSLVNILA